MMTFKQFLNEEKLNESISIIQLIQSLEAIKDGPIGDFVRTLISDLKREEKTMSESKKGGLRGWLKKKKDAISFTIKLSNRVSKLQNVKNQTELKEESKAIRDMVDELYDKAIESSPDKVEDIKNAYKRLSDQVEEYISKAENDLRRK